jgi:hydrogenase expression/formation protein HypC
VDRVSIVYYSLMCLAVPALIRSIDGTMADAELGGVMIQVNILLTPEVKEGDYVIMHAGYAISVMNSDEAEATLKLLEEVTGADAEQ